MHKRINKTFLILVVTALSVTKPDVLSGADGNEVPEGTYELPPYVVVATRTLLPLDQVSPSVSYISEEEMTRNQDRRLVDFLKRQPGMVLNPSGATGAQTSLFIRGTESSHTAVFLDGRRLNPGFSNQFGLEFLSIDNLSSVEVQRGPSSVNFGSSGIGGVVSLQSRSDLGEKKQSVGAEVEYGSYDYYRGALDASFSDEDWALSLGASALTTENKRNNDDFDTLNLNGRSDYRLTDHLTAEFLGFITKSDKGFPGQITAQNDTAEGEANTWLMSPGLRYKNEDWNGRLFYARSRDVFHNQFGSKSIVNSDELYAQANYSGIERLLISFGALYRNDEAINDSFSFSGRFEQTGLWTQVQAKLTDALEVRLSGRYDRYTDYDDSVDGSVETLYSFPELGTTLFARLATSYAPPTALDITFDSNPVSSSLNPEESTAYEIGFKQLLLNDRIELSTVAFRNEIDELITFDPVSFDTINEGDATTEGIEFSASYELIEGLNLGSSYTYLVAINDDTDERLLRRPRHLLQLFVNYQITDQFFTGLQGIGYFDRKDIDASFNSVEHEDYFVMTVLTDYELTEHFTLFARVENLLDETYEPVLGYPALGRTGYLGARLRF